MLENLVVALISLLAGHFLPKVSQKWKLKKTFGYLQGDWAHFNKDHERILGNDTTLTHTSDRKLEVRSTTKYGNWHGVIEMSESMPKKGVGYFQYDDKDEDEGGDLEIFVNNNNEIWVYPRTHTHKHQKTDFYLWKREG